MDKLSIQAANGPSIHSMLDEIEKNQNVSSPQMSHLFKEATDKPKETGTTELKAKKLDLMDLKEVICFKRTAPDGTLETLSSIDPKFEGLGEVFYRDGSHYEGSFKDGKFSGWGNLTFCFAGMHSKYDGSFKKGKFHGFGDLTYADGSRYTGKFIKGEPEGKGEITKSDGAVYEGEFKKGKIIQ